MQKRILAPGGKSSKKETFSQRDQRKQDQREQDQRDKDRRKVKSEGYTYVPMVGWFCRRARIRRNDEEYLHYW